MRAHAPRGRRAAALLLLPLALLSALLATPAPADDWRAQAQAARHLAERDAPAAWVEVQRLQAALPADAPPADRAALLNAHARIASYLSRLDEAEALAREALELARQAGDRVGQAEAEVNRAHIAINAGRVDELDRIALHALTLLEGAERPDLVGEAMLRQISHHMRANRLEEAVADAMQAMEIARRHQDPWALAYAWQGLAIAHDITGRAGEAEGYYKAMAEATRLAGSTHLEAHALRGLAYLADQRGDTAEAERLAHQAIGLCRSTGIPYCAGHALATLAHILARHQRHAEALPLLDETAAIFRNPINPLALWWTLDAHIASHLALGDPAMARRDAEEGAEIAERIGLPLYQGRSARRLAELAAAEGDLAGAYGYARTAVELADRTTQADTGERIVALTQRYLEEAQRKEVAALNRRNEQQAAKLARNELEERWLITLLGASLLVLTLTALFLYRLRRAHARLHRLIAAREQAREEERKRIAREVHDELGQLLTALKLGLSTLKMRFAGEDPRLVEPIQGLMGIIDQSKRSVRGIAASLRPAALDQGLNAALAWQVAELERTSGVRCRLELPEEGMALEGAVEAALFRIVQEALTNCARHAGATEVEVRLTAHGGQGRLVVRDDGRGFAPQAVAEDRFGLLGMRERVHELGGELVIDSAPGRGTRVEVGFGLRAGGA